MDGPLSLGIPINLIFFCFFPSPLSYIKVPIFVAHVEFEPAIDLLVPYVPDAPSGPLSSIEDKTVPPVWIWSPMEATGLF